MAAYAVDADVLFVDSSIACLKSAAEAKWDPHGRALGAGGSEKRKE